MKRILVFTSTFPKFHTDDATPPFVYELSKRLGEKKLEIVILTPRTPNSKIYEEKDNMKIYRFPYFFTEKLEKLNDGAILPNLKKNKLLYFQVPFLILAGFLQLIKIIKKENIDTIHAHWIIPQGFLAVLYKKIFRKNIKIICTTHGGDIFGLKGILGTFLKKYTFQNIDFLTVVSNAIKSECIKLGMNKDKIEVISMGVDDTHFSPDKCDNSIKQKYNITGKFLLFVGRLAEKKGVKYLIEAMVEITKSFPETKLLIIGHGPLEQELRSQTIFLNLEKNIIFVGAIPNSELPKYYATADIFIGPSIIANDGDREGLPVTYLEAISSGCLLLGSNLEGNKDLIIEGENGYFLEQKNSKDIIQKVIQIFEKNNFDKKDARKIIQEKFSWNIISEKYFNLLKK